MSIAFFYLLDLLNMFTLKNYLFAIINYLYSDGTVCLVCGYMQFHFLGEIIFYLFYNFFAFYLFL